jgi:hypothetical protein
MAGTKHTGGRESRNQTNHNENNSNRYKKPLKDIVIFLKNKDNQPYVQNVISCVALLVAAWLAIVTYSLFHQTLISTKAAIRADSIAKASLDANQREVDLENQPLVQALAIVFDTLKIGKRVNIKYEFVNNGKQPVKCIRNMFSVEIIPSETFVSPLPNTKFIISDLHSFLNGAGTAATRQGWVSDSILSKPEYDAMKKAELYTYVFGYLEFRNIVTNKTNYYEYNFKLYFIKGNYSVLGLKDTVVEKATPF